MNWLLVLALGAAEPAVTLEAVDCPVTLVTAIRDELAAAGFTTELASDAGAQVAHAALRCEEALVHVQLEDRVNPKSVGRTLPFSARPRSEVLIAIQVVELLHASLAETRFAALTQVPVPQPVVRFLEQREPTAPSPWNVAFGGGVTYAPGGFGAQPSVSAEVSRAISSWSSGRLELGASLGATVGATVLRSTGGEADTGLVESRALLAAAFSQQGWKVRPRVSLGVLWVWATGRSEGLYEATAGATGTFEAGVGVSASRALTSWLSLTLGVEVAVTPFPIQVQLPDSTTRIGVPILGAQLGVVFR